MTIVQADIITTLLLYLLTSQEKVYSDVLLKDKSENITCNVTEGKEKFVWYKYDGGLFKYATENQLYAPPSDGIFTCAKNNSLPEELIPVHCTTKNTSIIPSITGDIVPINITERIGKNVSFQTQFHTNISYTLLWIVKQQNVSRCIYSMEHSFVDFNILLNPLCCSSDAIKDKERIRFTNLTAINEPNQKVSLDLVDLTSSDCGEYSCIKLSYDQGVWKWNILSKYSLEVTGVEGTYNVCTRLTHEDIPSDGKNWLYVIAGSIGGFIALVAILLLTIFCIKNRGEQKTINRSSPVGLPDDYECMPYAVSERKEMSSNIYSLAQNPVSTTDTEYSEVQLTNLALSGAHTSESVMKANIVPDEEYAEIKNIKPLEDNDACHAYSVVKKNKK